MWAALLPAAYLVGMFPSAQLVAGASGIDITLAGSGNPGASNVTRTLGWQRGLLVFVLDALKGALAAGLGLLVASRGAGYALGAAAIVGHVFPIARSFRGGKGVATGAGVVAVLHPLVSVGLAAIWFTTSRVTGKAALASIVVAAALPFGVLLTDNPGWEIAATVALCALVVIRHAANVQRLWHREEHRLQPQGRP